MLLSISAFLVCNYRACLEHRGDINMNVRCSLVSALVAGAVCVLAAGAGNAQGGVEVRSGDIKVYPTGELSVSRYEVVGRPWIDSWRTAFWLPTFPSAEQATDALKTEAASRGADGLVNVFCLDQGNWFWSSDKEPAYLCYGTAIRVRPSQG
jgi:hypothetical protein